jgi:hypothetical protein
MCDHPVDLSAEPSAEARQSEHNRDEHGHAVAAVEEPSRRADGQMKERQSVYTSLGESVRRTWASAKESHALELVRGTGAADGGIGINDSASSS